jgi:isopenicillin-N N-acyltransferase like protein
MPCSLAISLLLMLALFNLDAARACTLWTAAGADEHSHAAIFLAKNHDWQPNHSQTLQLVRATKGYDYLGLFAIDGDEPGLKAGINRQGLAIVSASASSIPRQVRQQASGEKGLMRRLLSSCASVDELTQAHHLFAKARPMFLLVADPSQALVVEIGQKGEYRLDKPQREFFAHTNHFLHPELANNNSKIGTSSRQRLATVNSMLGTTPSPLSLADHIAISEDQSHGPNNSILRTGLPKDGERTLATRIVALPAHTAPTLYVKLRNPGEEKRAVTLNLDHAFWETTTTSGVDSRSGIAVTQ